ncbi:transcriptional regulator FnrL [Oceanicella actignis]|uniref:CRP/FNR family transcriptional regulator, anaerobic regulatory protein n=1 Tax=Oceanicella actignis TaxID=1189325 RepID=A0A1M7TJT0_9RHOB|nr:helix-turn-helix domain-containing protein [Oceanicella actignis]TYO88192.1 CRP/FNR family transcriptional regulator [Oceanicella actignis]SET67126.1 CRP/FNR family transcriptional regulator, anaerobic regulatory protein [Oceanicella actignis]SHN70977.1 CRP/FNR family transcriptional regulator, anaerobic regulatory protein [Oceanicella actignis]
MKPATTLRPERERCADCLIRHRAVCSHCGPAELEFLDAIKSYRTFKPGEEITAMGQETDFLGSVVNGVVSLSRILADGRRQMVGLLFPSDFIGRPMRAQAPFDAIAVTDVKLCIFSRPRFEALLRDTPSLESRLLEMTLDELDAARDWMVLLGRKTAREKMASFFLLVARRLAAVARAELRDGVELELPLTREDMADFLGLTIETVSRQISALRKAGAIELTDARHMRIPDIAALAEIAGDDDDGGMID